MTPALQPPAAPQVRANLALLLLAALLTLLNALRPLHMDDTAYYYYAAHIAGHPFDPYGFEIFWNDHPQPANEVLAPPVLPYYWAVAIRLFGERPFLWKMWMFPFSVLFVFAVHRLGRRFAPGREWALLCLTALSPAFLPSFNLMLDVPAQALGLFALTVFFAACARDRAGLACVAGIVAALAVQTKYTALLSPAAMLLYALFVRRLRLGVIAAGVTFAGFAAWETFMTCRYGQSHFLFHLTRHSDALQQNHSLLLSLIMILGGVSPALMLMALVALKARPMVLALAGSCVLLGFALLPCLDEVPLPLSWSWLRLSRDSLIFGGLGFFLCGMLAGSLWRSCLGKGPDERADKMSWFLVMWLGVEVMGYFLLAPFPAVRRILGIVFVAVLLISRFSCRTWQPGSWQVRTVSLAGILLGLGYYGVDLLDAQAQQRLAEESADRIRLSARGVGWYVGHWGFQFYAERGGLHPVVPGRSCLHAGDWLVVPSERVNQQKVVLPREATEAAVTISIADAVPFRTMSGYYGSRTPVEPLAGPRVAVTIYRVLEDFTPVPSQ